MEIDIRGCAIPPKDILEFGLRHQKQVPGFRFIYDSPIVDIMRELYEHKEYSNSSIGHQYDCSSFNIFCQGRLFGQSELIDSVDKKLENRKEGIEDLKKPLVLLLYGASDEKVAFCRFLACFLRERHLLGKNFGPISPWGFDIERQGYLKCVSHESFNNIEFDIGQIVSDKSNHLVLYIEDSSFLTATAMNRLYDLAIKHELPNIVLVFSFPNETSSSTIPFFFGKNFVDINYKFSLDNFDQIRNLLAEKKDWFLKTGICFDIDASLLSYLAGNDSNFKYRYCSFVDQLSAIKKNCDEDRKANKKALGHAIYAYFTSGEKEISFKSALVEKIETESKNINPTNDNGNGIFGDENSIESSNSSLVDNITKSPNTTTHQAALSSNKRTRENNAEEQKETEDEDETPKRPRVLEQSDHVTQAQDDDGKEKEEEDQVDGEEEEEEKRDKSNGWFSWLF